MRRLIKPIRSFGGIHDDSKHWFSWPQRRDNSTQRQTTTPVSRHGTLMAVFKYGATSGVTRILTQGGTNPVPHSWWRQWVPRLDTWPAMCSNCWRSKGHRSRSQGHADQHGYNSAVDGHINFKLGENYRRGVDACGILSTSVGQTNRKYKYGWHSAYKMQKSTENVAKSPKFCTLVGNRGRGIERWCLNLHRKFKNNRFCACAVKMLLKMAVNTIKCSTFEVQYGKSTASRTTAIGHLGYLKQITWFRACAETHTSFDTEPCIISQITLIHSS